MKTFFQFVKLRLKVFMFYLNNKVLALWNPRCQMKFLKIKYRYFPYEQRSLEKITSYKSYKNYVLATQFLKNYDHNKPKKYAQRSATYSELSVVRKELHKSK